jgi:geranylgeranyl pyrophosphate synthase
MWNLFVDFLHASFRTSLADIGIFQARDYVRRSSGVQRTRELAEAYVDKAKEVLSHLPDSDAKSALYALSDRAVKRDR